MAAGKLTPKQTLFIQEYLKDLNASAAARRSGYSLKTADAMGRENLQKPAIKSAIDKAMAEREARVKIDADWVLRELGRMYKKTEEAEENNHALRALDQIAKHVSVQAYDKPEPVQVNVDVASILNQARKRARKR